MINVYAFVGILFVSALLIGSAVINSKSKENYNILNTTVMGVLIIMAVAEVLSVIFIFMEKSLSSLSYTFIGIICALTIVSAVIGRKQLILLFMDIPKCIKSIKLLDIVVLVIIGVQIFVAIQYIYLSSNDAYYVGIAATSMNTDTLFKYSPYTGEELLISGYTTNKIAALPIVWSIFAKITGTTATYMCTTIIPCIFISVAYILYRQIGIYFLGNKKDYISVFLIFICMFNIIIGKEYYEAYEMLTTCIWQGGSFLYNIALPSIFYFTFITFNNRFNIKNIIMLVASIIVSAMCVPKTGAFLGVIMTMFLAISIVLDKMVFARKNRCRN